MAAMNSDPVKYQSDRREKRLDLTLLDKAKEYFVCLHGGAPELKAVRDEIASYADADTLQGAATFAERMAIIVKGWHRFAAGEKITPASVKLRYQVNPDDGTRVLDESPVVGGIDLATDATEEATSDEDVTVEQAAEAAKAIREKKGDAPPAEVRAKDGIADQLDAIRAKHPGRVLFFEVKDEYRLYAEDAILAEQHIGVKIDPKQTVGKVQVVHFKKSNLVPAHTALNEAGYAIATVTPDGDQVKVTTMNPIAKKKKK